MVSAINPYRIIDQHIFWVIVHHATLATSPIGAVACYFLAPSSTPKACVLYIVRIVGKIVTVYNLMDRISVVILNF